jgi:hypothetical protein
LIAVHIAALGALFSYVSVVRISGRPTSGCIRLLAEVDRQLKTLTQAAKTESQLKKPKRQVEASRLNRKPTFGIRSATIFVKSTRGVDSALTVLTLS